MSAREDYAALADLAAKATPDERLMAELTSGLYRVSDSGVVTSLYEWRGSSGARTIKQTLNASGYPSVHLMIDGRRKHIPVHRLVALIWCGARPSPDHEVRHLDGDPLNNASSNLRWGTVAENAQDRERHGTSAGARNGRTSALKISGSRALHAKLNDADILAIRSSSSGSRLLGRMYGVHRTTIQSIRRGQTWKHI